MAAKIKYKLKQEKGVLHVGGGRFFYPGESYDLTDVETETYGHYFDVQEKPQKEETPDQDSNIQQEGDTEETSETVNTKDRKTSIKKQVE